MKRKENLYDMDKKYVLKQDYMWYKDVYQSAICQNTNLAFSGGNNQRIKLHNQYSFIETRIMREVKGTLHKKVHDSCLAACRILAYNCVLATVNNRCGFIIPRNIARIDAKHKKDTRFPTAYSWLRVLEIAERVGLGEVYIGEPDTDGEDVTYSIMVLSNKLKEDFALKSHYNKPVFNIHAVNDCLHIWDAPSKVKDRKLISRVPKSTVGLVDGKGLTKTDVRNSIMKINRHLDTFDIRDASGAKIDTFMHRSYIGNLDNYGRYYHSASGVSAVLRQEFTVNGESVVELDYSSAHVRILSERVGVQLPFDFKPYMVDDLGIGGDDVFKRYVCKLGIMMLLNASRPSVGLFNNVSKKVKWYTDLSADSLYKQMASSNVYLDSDEDFTHDKAKLVIEGLRKKNHFINQYFKGGMSGELQCIESNILTLIMNKLVDAGVGFLPYHDSVLVASSGASILLNAMHSSWSEILGSSHNAVVSSKTISFQSVVEEYYKVC